MTTPQTITVATTVKAPVEKTWRYFTEPEHITRWNCASDDWHSPRAVNDLRVGGTFSYRMEAKDGSAGFDFDGTYDEVKPNKLIAYTIGDGRKVRTIFNAEGGKTHIVVTFEAESENPIEMQRGGLQAILNNFKKHVEATAARAGM